MKNGADATSTQYLSGGVGAKVVRLGKLTQRNKEDLIIDVTPVDTGHAATFACDTVPSVAETSVDIPDQPIIEDDLCLQEYGSDDEAPHCASARVWAPGSLAGRKLMEARSKQCIICLSDKEHTIVPPHRHENGNASVEGHRVCTECWANFLYHGLRQQGRDGRGPPPLACPLCRCTIDVPDSWIKDVELPLTWRFPRKREPMQCLTNCTPRSLPASLLWWQRPSLSSASDSESSEGEPAAAKRSSVRCPSFGFEQDAVAASDDGAEEPVGDSNCFL